jgi:hypothetical protein
MKIIFFSISLLAILVSCSDNTKICDCLEAGEKLQSFSVKMFTREASSKDLTEMKRLKKIQLEKCKDFQTMDGKKMLELKEECE